jgi:hypothetical protein
MLAQTRELIVCTLHQITEPVKGEETGGTGSDGWDWVRLETNTKICL